VADNDQKISEVRLVTDPYQIGKDLAELRAQVQAAVADMQQLHQAVMKALEQQRQGVGQEIERLLTTLARLGILEIGEDGQCRVGSAIKQRNITVVGAGDVR